MKSALGIMLLLTAQVQAIPFTHEFTGATSDADVVGLDDFGITRNSALPLAYDTPGFTLSCDSLALASAGGPFDVWVRHITFQERRAELRRLQTDQAKSPNGKPPVSNRPVPKRAKQKKTDEDITGVVRVPDFGGTALLFLLSCGLLIAINHRRSPRPASL